MFGIAVASMETLSDDEKARYQSVYCGLCLELKRRYGQVSRLSLNYDLAFLAMLYMSLYEPEEECGTMGCILHPGKPAKKASPYAVSGFTSYCADLSVALAYHKCLDDISDENSYKARAMRSALESDYSLTRKLIPEQCEVIGEALAVIRTYESDPSSTRDPAMAADAASIAFGEMLGFLFESEGTVFGDLWARPLRQLGFDVGRFVYLMDAAVDFRSDAKHGEWNPFVLMSHAEGESEPDPVAMRDTLSVVANGMSHTFEKLPLVQDIHILRSILYSGVWQKFNSEYEKDDPRITCKIN